MTKITFEECMSAAPELHEVFADGEMIGYVKVRDYTMSVYDAGDGEILRVPVEGGVAFAKQEFKFQMTRAAIALTIATQKWFDWELELPEEPSWWAEDLTLGKDE